MEKYRWEEQVSSESEEEFDDEEEGYHAEEPPKEELGNSRLQKILKARHLNFRNVLCATWLVLRYKVSVYFCLQTMVREDGIKLVGFELSNHVFL